MNENKKQAATTHARQQLLHATVEIARLQGISGVTLDAVAKQAGMSKGGLLHHFPSKNALVEALVRHMMTQFFERVNAIYEREPEGRGRWLRAYVRASFEPEPILQDVRTVLAMFIENPIAMQIAQEDADQWMVRFTGDGISPARLKIIQRAADAQWVESRVGVETSDTQDILDELMLMIQQEG